MAKKLKCPECGGALRERQATYEKYGDIPYRWRGHSYSMAALFAGTLKEICDYVYQSPTWEEAKAQYEGGR